MKVKPGYYLVSFCYYLSRKDDWGTGNIEFELDNEVDPAKFVSQIRDTILAEGFKKTAVIAISKIA